MYSINDEKAKFDCLVMFLFEDKKPSKVVEQMDDIFGGVIQRALDLKDFEGKAGQSTLLYTQDRTTKRVLLIGLGAQKELSIRMFKQAIGRAVLTAQEKKVKQLGLLLPDAAVKEWGGRTLGTEVATAVEVGAYSFDAFKEKKAKVAPLKKVHVVCAISSSGKRAFQKGLEDGQAIASGVNFTRRLGNTPPMDMTPAALAGEAEALAKEFKGLRARVLSQSQIEKLGMGCFLGVARGSVYEPKFIILEYNKSKGGKPTVLVGKGITFDTGGLSIKPGDYMTDMKFDMLGAATVLGTMRAIAGIGLKKYVVGLVATCENAVGGDAFRPDDILTAMNGKTVEIKNTDAEGRLILADTLCYAKRYDPKEVIDFATLTGACLVALGNERSGLFSPEDKIAEKLYTAAQDVGEQLWRLPVGPEYSEAMKSLVADIKNIGGVGHPRYGGASTAAAFLQYFTDYPWAHIDLGSSYYNDKGKPWIRHGANGFGVQTMVEYLR